MDQEGQYLVNRVSLGRIRNRQEQRVIEAMRKLLPAALDFCGCRICTEDVYAAALTQLPAQYIPTGSMLVRKHGPSDADVEQIVQSVIDLVRIHPNHAAATGSTP